MLFWVLVRRGPSINFLEYIWANLSAYMVWNFSWKLWIHASDGCSFYFYASHFRESLSCYRGELSFIALSFSNTLVRLNYLLSVAFPRTYPWTWSYSEAVPFYSLVWLDCSLHWDAFRLIRAFLSKEWFPFMILSLKPNIAPGTYLPLK